MKVAKELSKYKLDLEGGVQDVRWEKSGTEPAANICFTTESGIRIMN
jgi:hypothetical protein